MTRLSDLGRPIIGHRHEGPPASELEHFIACPVCGQQIDMRDLRQVAYHADPEHEQPLELDA
ncbi:hypothetical protein FJV76_13280 [Mesorhizobium sp. WSM4303]|nr:hypothetical protein FJV77_07390 [Mesorhizobium sp. WSM4306]TRD04268.1 hypothetical protein FJV76_13280 [Mesorhizobium sp. WSM4303]